MSNTEPLVTVFKGVGTSAEMEAQAIHGLLESSGIESLVVRANVTELPVGSVEIRVVESLAERAREVILEGRRAGPEAAEAAEAESEI
jgi:DNA invertase Pin-like site-specific DNA recombinase